MKLLRSRQQLRELLQVRWLIFSSFHVSFQAYYLTNGQEQTVEK